MLTLVAIKILHEFFKQDRKLWTLVEKKARKFFTTSTGLDKTSTDAALATLLTTYDECKAE